MEFRACPTSLFLDLNGLRFCVVFVQVAIKKQGRQAVAPKLGFSSLVDCLLHPDWASAGCLASRWQPWQVVGKKARPARHSTAQHSTAQHTDNTNSVILQCIHLSSLQWRRVGTTCTWKMCHLARSQFVLSVRNSIILLLLSLSSLHYALLMIVLLFSLSFPSNIFRDFPTLLVSSTLLISPPRYSARWPMLT